tara:strand:- start:182 stop:1075 length:894 start_codon:yes stop_codon:yes gene_type:complete
MDPLTAALLVKTGSSLASGLASNKAAKLQAERMQARGLRAEQEGNALAGAAEKRRDQFGLGQSYSDLRQLVMQDPTSDYLRQQARRQTAGTVDALKSGGARALIGGASAASRAEMDSLMKIAGDAQIRKSRGLQVLGEAEQRVAREKLTDARTDLTLGRELQAEGLAMQYGGEDADFARKQARNQALIKGAEGLTMAGMTMGDSEFAQGMRSLDPTLLQYFTAKDGALVRGKTPGEFSHDNNPIDVVRDGEKIGEMTGGEGIVSPEDLGKLEQLAGDGRSPLHKFVRDLIRKLEKNG